MVPSLDRRVEARLGVGSLRSNGFGSSVGAPRRGALQDRSRFCCNARRRSGSLNVMGKVEPSSATARPHQASVVHPETTHLLHGSLGSRAGSGAPLCRSRARRRRLAFRNADNKPVAVFAATTLGYGVAAQFLGRAVAQPGEDVTTVVLARMVRVNELYLTLAHGRAATNGPFAWVASRATDLPSWEEINVDKGRAEKRRVTPAW